MKTIKSIPWIELRIFNSLFDGGGRDKNDFDSFFDIVEETLTISRNLFTQSSTVFSTAEGGIKTILIVF